MAVFVTFLLQFLIGAGIVRRFDAISKPIQKLSLSVLAGFFCSTLAIYFMEITQLPIKAGWLLAILSLLAATLNIRMIKKPIEGWEWAAISSVRISPFELILLVPIAYLLFFSVWRAYYLPVTPYDAVVGIDLLARSAVAEGRVVSSIFSRADLIPFLSTQPYYAPFTAFMQIIYRLAGITVGQAWLGVLTVAFFTFAYSRMSERTHPLISGILILFVLSAPELYAYTFLLQTDFSNAVFFSIGVLFTIDYLRSENDQYLWLAVLMLSAACWTRTETIFVVGVYGCFASLVMVNKSRKKVIRFVSAYLLIPFLFIILWNVVFFRVYFPVAPTAGDQISWTGVYSIKTSLAFLQQMTMYFFSVSYWGYLLYLFLAAWFCNLLVFKRMVDLWQLFWLVLPFFTFFIMLHHFTLMNVEFTFRRAIIKFILLESFLISELPLLRMLFKKLSYSRKS